MTTISVDCPAFLRPDNLDGSSFTVDVPSDHRGNSQPRVVEPGDRVLGVFPNGGAFVGIGLYTVPASGPWSLDAEQAVPGDLIVVRPE